MKVLWTLPPESWGVLMAGGALAGRPPLFEKAFHLTRQIIVDVSLRAAFHLYGNARVYKHSDW